MADRAVRLGLRPALVDWRIPALAGAMALFAALALGGAAAAGLLAARWQAGEGAALTIQVPAPDNPAAGEAASRVAAVLQRLRNNADVTALHRLGPAELDGLLKPWLGAGAADLALPMPAVITAQWRGDAPPSLLPGLLDAAAPGTLVATGAGWAARIAPLTGGIHSCAAAALLIVATVAAAVVALATRAGLARWRKVIEIVHGLGALESDIAGGFAWRQAALAGIGAAAGTLMSLPVLFWLGSLAAPSLAAPVAAPRLPAALAAGLASLPLIAAVIGWATAQLTVRGWLRSLP